MDNIGFKGFDFSNTINHTNSIANQLAEQEKEQRKIFNEIAEQNAKREAKFYEAANASIEQKVLLEQQLVEVKEQNLQLKENYRLLNELYESAKVDAKNSAKEAKANKIFGWVSFAVGTLIGIVGIVLGIIF